METLVLCRSDMGDGGWSLHPPGSTDEQIACGEAPLLNCGPSKRNEDGNWTRPNKRDYQIANAPSQRSLVILNHYPTPIRDQFPQRKSSVPLVVTHLNGNNYLAKISGEWWEIQAISMDKARLQAQQLEKISQTLLINPY